MKQGWELKKLGDFYEITSSKRVLNLNGNARECHFIVQEKL